jgi:hypothetical protein
VLPPEELLEEEELLPPDEEVLPPEELLEEEELLPPPSVQANDNAAAASVPRTQPRPIVRFITFSLWGPGPPRQEGEPSSA